ncbi:MAG: B12-binding domain-containing radical SAM protein [Deltaproteobacteria bacterium]|nr:B12-binding domain-containing radical SAM protein [Deltaproteobacteria bacterium]
MKKILLINPVYQISAMKNANPLALPPLGLLVLANNTPERFQVEIIDEAYQPVDFDAAVDLVGITCVSHVASRAYRFAAEFRKRGVPVVMGGVHVSFLPEEALRHADAIVIGEADEIWRTVLEDFEKGALKRIYQVTERPDIRGMKPLQRRFLKGKYFVDTVQTSRGCPHNCHFCSVPAFNGSRIRYRDIDRVLEEIRTIRNRHLFFVDDNIIGYTEDSRSRAMRLFEGLAPLKKEWAAQATIDIAHHDQLLKSVYDSGGRFFMIGLESISADTLNSMNKRVNLKYLNSRDYYLESIRKLHDHGIAIVGSFIFGQDHDSPDAVERTLDFIREAEVDAVQLCIQTPVPGTALYKQLADEGRLRLTDYPHDWDAYNMFTLTYEPARLTEDELYLQLFRAYKELSSFLPSLKRGLKTLIKTRSGFSTGISFFWNHGVYKTLKAVPELKKWTSQV